MKQKYFISVNYNTSNLIEKWVNNIRKKTAGKCNIIIIDNFFSQSERNKVKIIVDSLSIILIISDNIGYGAALNLGIKKSLQIEKENEFIFLIGNLDIEYKNLTENFIDGKYVYMPQIKEKNRVNRNPFFTILQKQFLPLCLFAGRLQSTFLLDLIIGFNKIIGYLPSRTWAIHGSLFCFHSSCIDINKEIFNNNSLLYCEELEFASYMQYRDVEIISSEVSINHIGQVSTNQVNSSKKKFLKLWWSSFQNWYYRWKL
jgi:hypothetical protein